MANIRINSIPTRVQYEASNGQTVFTYSFPIKSDSDLKVYKRAAGSSPDDADDLLTLTTDYTVTGANTASGGTIVLVVAAAANDIVTIVGDKAIDRTAIYDQSSTLKKADLNNDFNDNVMYDKQINTIADQLTPQYARSELIYRDRDNPGNNVRADKLILPMLNDGYIWVGRGDRGDNPDDIQAVAIGDYDNLGVLSADFILGTVNGALPNAQPLGSLTTGFVYNTTTGGTGTLSTVSAADVGTSVSTITQAAHGFTVGKWVYRSSGNYVLAKADDATTTESVGIVKEVVDANTFKLQQSGVITGLSGLTDGTLYYLSPSSAGAMTATKPTAAGQFSKPVFIAASTTGGWVLSHRPLDTAASASSAVQYNITQASHGFVVGEILRRNGGTNLYVKAQADSAANAEAIGMVVDVIDANTFTLQEIGYVTGLAGLVDGTVYFLDPAVAGGYTSTEPTTAGQVSKPVFIADSATTGWFLHYRGMVVGGTGGGGGTSGSQVLIVEQDTTSGTTIAFDNFVSTDYVGYIIKVDNVKVSGSGSNFRVQVGTGATPTYDTGSNYYTDAVGTSTYWEIASVTNDGPLSCLLYTSDWSNTSANADFLAHLRNGVQMTGAGPGSGSWTNITDDNLIWWDGVGTTAISSIRFTTNSAGFTSGKIRIYGIVA